MDVKRRWSRGKHNADTHARLAKRHAAREIPETGGEGDFTRDIARAAKRQQTNFPQNQKGELCRATVTRRTVLEPDGLSMHILTH